MGEFPPSKFARNTFKFNFKMSSTKSNNGMSFWALLICVFAYISIFYLFNLSPRALFNTNKFWFLISNTLIIIIAADSGAFSSSKSKNPDPRDQLFVTPHYNFRPMETPNKYNIAVAKENGKNHTPKDLQNNKTIVCNEAEESKEKPLEIVVQEHTLSCNQGDVVFEDKEIIEVTCDQKEKVIDHAKCKDDKNEAKIYVNNGDENDKFSSMSDDELNKRVDEFIRRFYNQQLKPNRTRELVDQM